MLRSEANEGTIVFPGFCRKPRLIDVLARAQHTEPVIINARIAMRHRILLAVGLLYLCAASVAWIAIDTRPPFWDMAGRADTALLVFRDFQDHGIAAMRTLPQESGSYPPLYFVVVALSYRFLGTTVDA